MHEVTVTVKIGSNANSGESKVFRGSTLPTQSRVVVPRSVQREFHVPGSIASVVTPEQSPVTEDILRTLTYGHLIHATSRLVRYLNENDRFANFVSMVGTAQPEDADNGLGGSGEFLRQKFSQIQNLLKRLATMRDEQYQEQLIEEDIKALKVIFENQVINHMSALATKYSREPGNKVLGDTMRNFVDFLEIVKTNILRGIPEAAPF